eukprot:TRINITY_DN2027_c0_g2_i14.p1 TRINITY_DN2027_c0_g2~~TRINITY_DN2027_c0_g2_i14.p1  ORF type:complete len:143 (+),score=2.02 TRINITY_DN2027_c0_g2_i14:284-712(+)
MKLQSSVSHECWTCLPPAVSPTLRTGKVDTSSISFVQHLTEPLKQFFPPFEGKYMTNFHISIVLRNYSFSLLSSMGLGKSKSEEIRDKRNFPINIFIHSSEPLVYRYLFFMTRQSGYIIISTSAFSTIVMVMRFGNLDFPIG